MRGYAPVCEQKSIQFRGLKVSQGSPMQLLLVPHTTTVAVVYCCFHLLLLIQMILLLLVVVARAAVLCWWWWKSIWKKLITSCHLKLKTSSNPTVTHSRSLPRVTHSLSRTCPHTIATIVPHQIFDRWKLASWVAGVREKFKFKIWNFGTRYFRGIKCWQWFKDTSQLIYFVLA